MRAVIACTIALSAGAMFSRPASAQPQRSVAYVLLRGADTIGTETLTITDTTIAGAQSIQGQPRIEWTQHRTAQTMTSLSMRVYPPGAPLGSAPAQMASVYMRGDSAVAELTAGGRTASQKIPSRAGAFPLINSSAIHAVLLATNARRKNYNAFDVFFTSGAQTVPATMALSGDTLLIRFAGTEIRTLTGPDGLPNLILTPQGVRIVRASSALTSEAASALGVLTYEAPSNAPYTAEQLRIPSGRGYDLAATLTKPKGLAKVPVVITISGSGPQERDSRVQVVPGYAIFREVADTLGRRGVAVLRFDDRGVGESGGRESAIKATSADFADDVRSIVKFLRARPDIDGTRIALAGHSEGGMIAPMVAQTDPALKGIALLAGPAYTGRRVMLFQNRQLIDNAPGLNAKQRDSIFRTVPAGLDSIGKLNPWIAFFMSHDPLPTARAVKQPVLILQGLTDTQVSPEQADTLLAAFRGGGNTNVTIRTFPATNHLFLPDASGQASGYTALKDAKVRKEVLGALADWAVKTLK